MKNKLVLIVLAIIIIFAGVLGIFIFKYVSGDKIADKGIQRNYGVSNLEIDVLDKNGNINTEGFDASKVVPSKSKLIENLTKAGYTIKQYTTVYDTGISAERIYASKNESSIDICYGLSETNAQEVFKFFEKKYPEFYLLAMNCNYVYFISDKQTFKNAGFTSLGNVGTQYICD
jgi:hypothetical protein